MLCECGCGQDSGVYSGYFGTHVKGEPKRFVNGHNRGGVRKTHCKRGHPLTEDNRNRNGSCRVCGNNRTSLWEQENREKKNAWRKRNPEKVKESARRSLERNPEAHKNASLKCAHGITLEGRNVLLRAQASKCAICGHLFTDTPYVDHNHACCPGARKSCGKCIRGLLCHHCNSGLGMFNDDPEILAKAIQYLKEAQCQTQQLLRTLSELKVPLAATA